MNNRVLVAGGAGFIGSHLCQKLINEGHIVYCVDNLYSGFRENIADLEANERFLFIRHDVTLPLDLEVDEIYNLACPASPVHYQSDPISTTMTSVMGAINLLDLASRRGIRILQASTSEVYGDPTVHPQREDYWGNVNPAGIRSCYDEGKRCAESLFFDYHRTHGVKIRVARIFNTYGPKMHPNDGRVVSNFIVQAIGGHNLTIYGDGSQTRSFCYVDDLVDGLVALMAAEGDVVGPVNLGNPTEMTVAEFGKQILHLTGSTSLMVSRPLPSDDPKRRQPDISMAREKLGWSPKVSVTEGLARTIAYFKALQDAAAGSVPPAEFANDRYKSLAAAE